MFEIKFWKFKDELGNAHNMKFVYQNVKNKIIQVVYLEDQR
jgi:hypothetical protein